MNGLRQRQPRIKLPKLTQSAKGKPCTLQSPWCNGNPETTVWAHSNFHEHGKAMGGKAHDCFGFYACSDCHAWFDTFSKQAGVSNEERRRVYHKANDASMIIAYVEGVLHD